MDFEKLFDFFLFHEFSPRNYTGQVPPETPVHEINYRITLKAMFDEWLATQDEDEE